MFHEAYDLTPDRIAQMESVVRKRVLRPLACASGALRGHGLLDEVDAAGTLTWQGSGGLASLSWRITRRALRQPLLAARLSVDASVRIEAEDRAGIERLVRYCARPPFALEPLSALGSTPVRLGESVDQAALG